MTNRKVIFITHANVAIDPNIPVPQWGLSDVGKKRHHQFNKTTALSNVTSIYTSEEQKAIDGGSILAEYIGVKPIAVYDLHENDRSSTGFMPPAEFQKIANLFFANPYESIKGWERAIDAQARIVKCVTNIIKFDATEGDIAIVAHGGVGTLLLCHLSKAKISRSEDQPNNGGGNYFSFDAKTLLLVHKWRDISEP